MRKIVFMLATMMTISMTASAALEAGASAPTDPQHTITKVFEVTLTPGMPTLQRDVSYSYDFGSVMVGLSTYRRFSLSNNGNTSLYIHSIRMSGADFSAAGNCPAVLRPRDYCNFDVRFSPWFEGYKSGGMYISTNSGWVSLYFTGWALHRY